MPNLTLNQFSGSLKTALQPLYVIFGEEDLLRLEAVDELRAAAKQQGYLNRETLIVDSAAFDWNRIVDSANSVSLFADLKLLEIHIPSGKLGKNGGEIIRDLAEKLPENTVTVIVLPKLDKTQLQSKWFTALQKNGALVEAKAVGVNGLPAWISERLQRYGLEIDTDALAYFAERVEGNLLAARQEIDKLALLYPPGHLLRFLLN